MFQLFQYDFTYTTVEDLEGYFDLTVGSVEVDKTREYISDNSNIDFRLCTREDLDKFNIFDDSKRKQFEE